MGFCLEVHLVLIVVSNVFTLFSIFLLPRLNFFLVFSKSLFILRILYLCIFTFVFLVSFKTASFRSEKFLQQEVKIVYILM